MRLSNVVVAWDKDAVAYRLKFSYNADFIEELKGSIDYRHRSYDPETRTWLVDESQFDVLKRLLHKMSFDPRITTREQAEKGKNQTVYRRKCAIEDVALSFLRLVPYEEMQKVYRRTATMLHPDHGGNGERMTELNVAWERLQKDLYAVTEGSL